jgi:uncharacterized protein (TIGR03086 family)
LLHWHRTALQATIDVVDTVNTNQLTRQTPCADWNLGELLTHMTVQHQGFAAAARGGGQDLAVWDPESVRDEVLRDPPGTYAAATRDVLAAFADADLETRFALPELGADAPAEMAIGFHFIDYVVHGWDVAASLSRPWQLPDDVIAAALPLALAVPDGDFRSFPNAPFGPTQSSSAPTDLDRLLLHLGRNPQWSA